MAPHSSTLAWKIPWTEKPGGLQSTGSRRVGHNWATSLSLFTFLHRRRKWQSTPVFLPGESQGLGGAWGAAVYGVAQSRTRLKRFSSSSSTLYSYRSTLHNTVFSEKSKCENYVILAFWEEKCRVVLACTYIAYFWKDKQETDFLNGCFQLPKIELSCDMYIIFTCFVH